MEKGISVIIPTYNRERFIKEAIQSVLDQNYDGKIEIIISDDGSTDNTLLEAKSFGDKVKILLKPDGCPTQGVASTRNRGIKYSSLPFICFLDSDDFYLPGHLEKMVILLEKEQELGFAFCRMLEVKEENSVKLFKPWTRKHILKNDIKNPVISRSNIVHTNSLMFRREVFDQVGYFNETYTNGEDGDLWMRISEKFKGNFAGHYGAAYRTHHGLDQLTKNSKKKINESALLIFQDAKKRYYNLKLKDQKRIFKIKHKLLWGKYRALNNEKINYYFKYITLIAQYPAGYFQKLSEDYFTKREKKENQNWETLKESAY